MGLGSFIAEQPGRFLALLGVAALGAMVFWSSDPVALRPVNPWALDPATHSRTDRLAPVKNAIERLGDGLGVRIRFAPVPDEPLATPSNSPAPRRHRRRRGHRHRKPDKEGAL